MLELFDATKTYVQGRRTVNGPTAHGLAVTAMMSLVIPFVLIGLQKARSNRDRVLYFAALTLVIAGSISTVRKTSIIAAAFLVCE